MEFKFSPQEDAFRLEVRNFIQKEFPAELRWNFGISYSPWIESHEGKEFEYIKEMRRKFGAKGLFTLSWPEEYGGQASYVLQTIADEEMMYSNCPALEHCGVTFFAPTLIRFGSDEQKRKYLPGIAAGEISWCELLSEPDSGSDLASLKTQAVEDGDYYIINGQKTWSTGAHHSQMAFVLVRTDPTQQRHRGLTYFMVDMNTPGITVRPLRNMLGEHEFNETFLDDVRVPKANIVGGLNRGWQVSMATLDFERFSHGYYASIRGYLDSLVIYLKQTGKRLDSVLKERLAQIYAECEMGKMLHYRAMSIMAKGSASTYEAAIDKMYNCELAQRASEFSMQALGYCGVLTPGSKYAPLNGWPSRYYLNTASYSMFAGTSEIDRNVIATQGLGMPNS